MHPRREWLDYRDRMKFRRPILTTIAMVAAAFVGWALGLLAVMLLSWWLI